MKLKLALIGSFENSSFQSDQWNAMLADLLSAEDTQLVSATVRLLTPRTKTQQRNSLLTERLVSVAKSKSFAPEVRLSAMQDLDQIEQELFAFALECLNPDQPTIVRGLAATAVSKIKLVEDQLLALADALPTVGPLELGRLLDVFETSTDEELGLRLIDALKECPAVTALPPERIASLAAKFGPPVSESAKILYASAAIDPASQSRRIDDLLASLPDGDVRRGQRVFHNEKAACFACHAMGYRGGTVGPDLTRVARIRSQRDLLEAVLYPSASFVRSYEPVNVLTVDGESVTGTINDQLPKHIVLQLNATEQRRIATSDIEEMLPSKVSVMPAGLDKQLTTQELADLLSFLESRK